MTKGFAFALALIVSGCATPSSGIVDVGNNYFTVAHQGDGVLGFDGKLEISRPGRSKTALLQLIKSASSDQRSGDSGRAIQIPGGRSNVFL